MSLSIKKTVAVIQICLQLLPPSSLLFITPSFNANAEEKVVTPSPPKESDNTESSVAGAAVQAGSMLSSGDVSGSLGSALASGATGMASSEVQQWLSQFGTAQVNISTDENFTLNDSSLDVLLPLYDAKENLLFTQLGGRRHDDRNIVNTGFGYRHFSEKWMWGTNIFYDAQVSSNHHQRLGVGTELGWDYLKLSANGYMRLSNWMSSSRYQDYDERVANGFDIRATGYLPAYPQLGANLIYEQYFGDSVGLFGDDEDDRQKDPYAVTVGLNYTPVPLVTIGANQKFGKSGENDTQFNLALTWVPGVPLGTQLDPDQVAGRRTLLGGRQDLVDRNNNIVLEYRKQDILSLSLPAQLSGEESSKQPVTAKVKSKYGLDFIEWQGASFYQNGGKVAAGSSPDQVVVTLPAWQVSGSNSYTLTGVAWDKKGNSSNSSQIRIDVNGVDVNTLQSSTTATPSTVPADGASTSVVTVTMVTAGHQQASGFAERLSASLLSSASAKAQTETPKAPTISAFSENTPGVYTATFTSGTTPDTVTVQPLMDGSVKLASVNITEEAATHTPNITSIDVSASSVLADNATPIELTAHVVDQFGEVMKNAVIDWSADNTQATLSASQSTTDEQGLATIKVTSADVIATVVTAQAEQGNSLTTSQLNFTADASSAQVVSISADKQEVIANNNDTNTVTAQVEDQNHHPLEGITVNWAVERTDDTVIGTKTSVTDSKGLATMVLKSAKTGTVNVVADVNSQNPMETEDITFVADGSTQKISSLTLDKTQAVADGSDAVTYEATVTDGQGNPLANTGVDWSSDNGSVKLSDAQSQTDSSGKTHITATSLKAGTVVVSAKTSQSASVNADSVTYLADVSTAKIESFKSDKISAVADRSDAITLTATVTDANGNLINGGDVAWNVTPATGVLSASSGKTDASGVASVMLTSAVVASYSVTATIGNSSQQVSSLSFVADSSSAQVVSLTADKTADVVADGDEVTLTAQVQDSNQQPVANMAVTWSDTGTGSTYTPSASTTDENGLARVTFKTLKAGSVDVTASANGTGQTVTLQVTGNAATAKIDSLKADKARVNVGGSVTYTAEITDANDNPVNKASVAWSTTLNKLSDSSTDTNSSGLATVSLSGNSAGQATVTAKINDSELSDSSVTFVSMNYDWVITDGSAAHYEPAVTGYVALGFIAREDTQGPTALYDYAISGSSPLVVPMVDEQGKTVNVNFGGQRSGEGFLCTNYPFNAKDSCGSATSGYQPRFSYSTQDNPDLPAGVYTGTIKYSAVDGDTDQTVSDLELKVSLTIK
ncbi:intimin-like protein [Enterobacteriaceae bacterium 89]|nr:intimin-like protein [Enterobacteriaceae bacterium 89]